MDSRNENEKVNAKVNGRPGWGRRWRIGNFSNIDCQPHGTFRAKELRATSVSENPCEILRRVLQLLSVRFCTLRVKSWRMIRHVYREGLNIFSNGWASTRRQTNVKFCHVWREYHKQGGAESCRFYVKGQNSIQNPTI